MGENELDCSAILLGQEFNMLLDLNKILIGPTTFPSTASRWGRAQFDYYWFVEVFNLNQGKD